MLELSKCEPVKQGKVQVTKDVSEPPMILIKSAEEHDLVLEFDNVSDRKKFLVKLEGFINGFKKVLEIQPISREVLLANAETKERIVYPPALCIPFYNFYPSWSWQNHCRSKILGFLCSPWLHLHV